MTRVAQLFRVAALLGCASVLLALPVAADTICRCGYECNFTTHHCQVIWPPPPVEDTGCLESTGQFKVCNANCNCIPPAPAFL